MVTWCQVSDIFIRPQYFVSGITLVEQSSDELCFRILSEWCYMLSQMHLKSSKGMNPMTPMTLIMTVAMRSRHLWGNNHECLEAFLARRCHSIAESWSIISRPTFFAGSLRFVMLCSRKHTDDCTAVVLATELRPNTRSISTQFKRPEWYADGMQSKLH
jgi:hypothetical protein